MGIRAASMLFSPALVLAVSCWACAARTANDPALGRGSAEPVSVDALSEAPGPVLIAEAVAPPIYDPSAPPSFEFALRRQNLGAPGFEAIDYAYGSGRAATAGDRVRMHYRGQLRDGTEFDSTYARDRAFEVEIGHGRMIPGMEIGLEGARAGMLRELVIPPELGYAERAVGEIPAHATLIFFIEVLSVEPGAGPPPDPTLISP